MTTTESKRLDLTAVKIQILENQVGIFILLEKLIEASWPSNYMRALTLSTSTGLIDRTLKLLGREP